MLTKPYPAPDVTLPQRPTPLRFLLAVLGSRPWLAVSAAVLGAVWLVPGAFLPLVVGDAIDRGIAGADTAELAGRITLIVGIGVGQAVFGGALMFAVVGMWLHGASTTQRLVATHVARLGGSLRAQASSGEVLAISSSDLSRIGNVFEVSGRLLGSVVAFLAVGVALLSYSPLLAGVALVGVPLAVAGIGPLVAPIQRKVDAQRQRRSAMSAVGADVVSGLRILRGVGGERQFEERFRTTSAHVRDTGMGVARAQSWLAAAEVVLPGLVTVAITWLGARLALAGDITAGELVAFYGASAFLAIPVTTATMATGDLASALVSAGKVCRLLSLRRQLPEPEDPATLPDGPLDVGDPTTGLTAPAGELTVVDAGEHAEAIMERLSRFTGDGEPALLSGVPADRVALGELRDRVVYAHNQDVWFSGILAGELDAARRRGGDVDKALWAADADDILAGLPQGLGEYIGERGREVSGGQRQRLSLARALVTDPDVLVLDEPTSAVDAHTEARITERVAALRRGRTTIVFAQSALWDAAADHVLISEDLTLGDTRATTEETDTEVPGR